MSDYKIIKAVDRWNATSDRTIDDQDHVVVQIADGDKTVTKEMSVAEFRNNAELTGTAEEKNAALAGADWYSLNDGAALKEFSLKGRMNTGASSLPVAADSKRFTDVLLSTVSVLAPAVAPVMELISIFTGGDSSEGVSDDKPATTVPTLNDRNVIRGAEDPKKPSDINVATA